ncbi:MAG: hypothetical protein KBD78_14000 [Oligoflexales bacterium]|nr:hypothetical protein [Oligoflexales bacterium]
MATAKVTRYNKSRLITPLLLILFMVPPFLAAIYYTTHKAAAALIACQQLKIQNNDALKELSPKALVEFKRKIQQHFRHYQIYLPLEDIVVNAQLNEKPDSFNLSTSLQENYGVSQVYLFVPLRFHLPFVGENVIEYVFKPQHFEPGADT